ncbi:MAG: hypothetical protein KJI71_05060 [Patescibacteria group bacterium]|nr:hypothetical protein [Patescibacteria group bacterium]
MQDSKKNCEIQIKDVYKSFFDVKGKMECFDKKDGSLVCRSRKTKDPIIRFLSDAFADYFCGL